MELILGEEQSITTFAQAVQHVSGLAQARLPASLHGTVQRATALVLGGHVWMDDDGKHAQVRSSDGTTWYHANGHCTCMGVTHAPQGLCKHRVSVMIYKRASELLAASGGTVPVASAPALPEAPASVNVRLCIGGAECQWTLRDTDETRLAERLQALLARFPQKPKTTASAASTPAQTSGDTPICGTHGPMKASTKAPGTFFCSKKNFDGSYCQSRHPQR